MKRFFHTAVLVVLTAALLGAVSASAADLTFSDVPESHWAYGAVTAMVQDGLFKGKTEPVDGVGTFAPDAPMTRAEFVTVLTRLLWPDRLTGQTTGGKWWQENYETALAAGLLYDGELDGGALDVPMERQEAAMVLVRASAVKGFPARMAGEEAVADLAEVDEIYRNYVRTCFALGILCGVDSRGSFAPHGTLTRAQAATVIYRLMDGSGRTPLDNAKTTFINTEGFPRGEDLPTIAGQLAGAERPMASQGMTLEQARQELNAFLETLYDYRFLDTGIAKTEDGPGTTAKLICHADGRLGVEVTAWREDYNSTPEENQRLNLVLEAFAYLSGDRAAAYALWCWKDDANVNGSANSDHFGFTDESWTSGKGGVIRYGDTRVEVDQSVSGATRYYFG